MRTTLTLEDDVAARLQAEARRTGRPFKAVSTITCAARSHNVRAPRRPALFACNRVIWADPGRAAPTMMSERFSMRLRDPSVGEAARREHSAMRLPFEFESPRALPRLAAGCAQWQRAGWIALADKPGVRQNRNPSACRTSTTAHRGRLRHHLRVARTTSGRGRGARRAVLASLSTTRRRGACQWTAYHGCGTRCSRDRAGGFRVLNGPDFGRFRGVRAIDPTQAR